MCLRCCPLPCRPCWWAPSPSWASPKPFLRRRPINPRSRLAAQKVVTITRKAVSTTKPEFTSVTVAPGRGMEILQITANFPGKGNVNVLASPDLAGAKKMLDVEDDAFGNLGYRLGAAILVPYPNRIRGKLSADGKTLTTEWQWPHDHPAGQQHGPACPPPSAMPCTG